MALYTVSTGNPIQAADVNQVVQALNGTTANLAVALGTGSTLAVSGSAGMAWDAAAAGGLAVNTTSGTISFRTSFNGRVPVVVFSTSQGTAVLASVSATGFTVTQSGGAGTYTLYWVAVG